MLMFTQVSGQILMAVTAILTIKFNNRLQGIYTPFSLFGIRIVPLIRCIHFYNPRKLRSLSSLITSNMSIRDYCLFGHFRIDRKSTRLNSSHSQISYAVFFFNDTATTEIYTLSLHDALPISRESFAVYRVLLPAICQYGITACLDTFE